jgi:aminocarboxymuconate-semialdehyde decarboxylase
VIAKVRSTDLRKGTDHPFFPPLNQDEKEWASVTMNSKAVRTAFGEDAETAQAVMGGNAIRILRLDAS